MRYEDLIKVLHLKRSLKGGMTLTYVGCAYYIVRFTTLEDYNFVMTQDPWIITLTIRKWILNFVPNEEHIKVLIDWIRVSNLSVEYFDKGFLYKIGVGKITK